MTEICLHPWLLLFGEGIIYYRVEESGEEKLKEKRKELAKGNPFSKAQMFGSQSRSHKRLV